MLPPFGRNVRLILGFVVALVPTGITLVMAYQRRWLDDDGFINLRIVRNLLEGYGPVFNLDERVEAGTSPLWLALITLLGGLGARLEDTSVFTGIVLTVLAVLLAQDAASRLYAPAGSTLSERVSARWLPLGALVIAVLPPIWDYASSGLETGLSLCWLAGAYDLLVAALRVHPERPAPTTRGQVARSLVLGLGILIRPELTLYAVGFFCVYLVLCLSPLPSKRARLDRGLSLMFAFGTLPLAYQLFRMGYYGAVSPNTAIAKEAFLVNWQQGRCYLRNFVNTYRLRLPLIVLALSFAWLLWERLTRRDALVWVCALLPPGLALVHATYVVRMGGDYMHARMFLPALFAALLPVAVVPANLSPRMVGNVVRGAGALVVLGWCWLCGTSLRVAEENQCDIGDERGWYARVAETPNPVRLEEYEKHPFYGWGKGIEGTLTTSCPELFKGTGDEHPGCRQVHLPSDEASEIYPYSLVYTLAPRSDGRLLGVVSQGAIGMTGFMLPSRVHVSDIHGLADPLVSRVLLTERGRPGHEKTMPVAWRLARYTPAVKGEDASVAAARHALSCGALASLERSVRDPLSTSLFFSNMMRAVGQTKLRIPRDPFDAEAHFCGAPRLTQLITSGTGGDAYHFRCPAGSSVQALRGRYDSESATVARIVASCTTDPGQLPAVSRPFGGDAGQPFSLECPSGTLPSGLFGTADKVVHSVGFMCTGPHGVTQSEAVGRPGGPEFTFSCPRGETVRAVLGRAGMLLDSIGIGCAAEP